MEALQGAKGEQVIGAADGREVGMRVEQGIDALGARVGRETGLDHEPGVGLDAGVLQAAAIAVEPLAGDVQRGRPGQAGDVAMTELDECRDHRRDAAGIVDADLGLAQGVRR